MLTINVASPYNSVYGPAPALLPELSTSSAGVGPETVVHVHRLRESSVQAIAEGAARERINRATRASALLAGQ